MNPKYLVKTKVLLVSRNSYLTSLDMSDVDTNQTWGTNVFRAISKLRKGHICPLMHKLIKTLKDKLRSKKFSAQEDTRSERIKALLLSWLYLLRFTIIDNLLKKFFWNMISIFIQRHMKINSRSSFLLTHYTLPFR